MKPDGFMNVVKAGRLKVVPEGDTGLVTLKPGQFQKVIFKKVIENRKKNKPTRIAVVKARRVQITTGCAVMMYGDMVENANFRALAVSHDQDAIEVLKADVFDTLKNNDPEAPEFKYDSAERVQTREGSRITYSHAKAELSRGGKQDFVLLSEADFYGDFFKTMKGIPKTSGGHSVVIVETTLGDRPAPQFREWLRQLNEAQKNGESAGEWELIFFGWIDFLEYRLPLDGPQEREHIRNSLDATEKELMKRGVDFEQLKWRRYMIETEFMGDVQGFNEEYPDDLDTLLESKGNHYFRPDILDWMEKRCTDAEYRYEVTLLEGKVPEFTETSKTSDIFEVWEPPQPDHEYSIGVDVADDNSQDGKDNSCLFVIDDTTGDHVASWVGRIDPKDLGEILYCVALRYNESWCHIEKNGPGQVVIQTLLDLGYFNIGASRKIAKLGNTIETSVIGQRTDKATRPWMLSELRRVIHKKKLKTRDKNFVAELRTFVDLKGKPQAMNRKLRDDRVLSAAQAVVACENREHWQTKSMENDRGERRSLRRVVKEPTAQELLNNLRRGTKYSRYSDMLGT